MREKVTCRVWSGYCKYIINIKGVLLYEGVCGEIVIVLYKNIAERDLNIKIVTALNLAFIKRGGKLA